MIIVLSVQILNQKVKLRYKVNSNQKNYYYKIMIKNKHWKIQ